MLQPRYSKDEHAQRGQTLYKHTILPSLTPADEGKFVAIDVETGTYELDTDDYSATERLLLRHPTAQIWLCRAGHRAAYRVGLRPTVEAF